MTHGLTCPNDAWIANDAGDACVPTGATVSCLSDSVIITALVDHLYDDLPADYHSDVRIVFGSCTGIVPPTSGSITETFDLAACDGTFSQDGDIHVDFEVTGNDSPITTTVDGVDIVLTSKLEFNAHCDYASTAVIDSSAFDIDTDSVTADTVEGTTGTFDDKFSLAWYGDVARTNTSIVPTLGENVYMQASSSLSIDHTFYLTSCTATEGSSSVEIYSLCDDIEIDDVLGVAAYPEASSLLDFEFKAFALSGESGQNLTVSCDIEICLLNSDSTQADSSCGTCPSI